MYGLLTKCEVKIRAQFAQFWNKIIHSCALYNQWDQYG